MEKNETKFVQFGESPTLQLWFDRHNAFEPGGAVERLIESYQWVFFNGGRLSDMKQAIAELEALLPPKEEA